MDKMEVAGLGYWVGHPKRRIQFLREHAVAWSLDPKRGLLLLCLLRHWCNRWWLAWNMENAASRAVGQLDKMVVVARS